MNSSEIVDYSFLDMLIGGILTIKQIDQLRCRYGELGSVEFIQMNLLTCMDFLPKKEREGKMVIIFGKWCPKCDSKRQEAFVVGKDCFQGLSENLFYELDLPSKYIDFKCNRRYRSEVKGTKPNPSQVNAYKPMTSLIFWRNNNIYKMKYGYICKKCSSYYNRLRFHYSDGITITEMDLKQIFRRFPMEREVEWYNDSLPEDYL